MKISIIIKRTAMLLCAAALVLSLTGCARDGKDVLKPTASPMTEAAASQTAKPSPSPTAEAKQTETAGSAEPSVSPSAGASEQAGEGGIDGFMEGGIVDPDDVPMLREVISRSDDYKDSQIQSVTYKLYEGRQAYYVVMNGAPERRLYVFADGSIIPAE